MRREPKQETVREGKREERREMPHHEAAKHRMEGYREGLRHGHMDAMGMKHEPAKPPDPQKKGGDGIKAAFAEPKLPEKGKPSRAPDPEKKKGDGMAVAMRGEAGKQSKLSPMGGAEKRVR